MVPGAYVVRSIEPTIIVVYSASSNITTMTNGDAWPETMSRGHNDPVLAATLKFTPAPRRARRPQQPALVDPWIPHRLAAAPPPPAWPAQLRRFRGDV